ncbi:unnamed protein product [Arctia plantaginis]|uniref:Peptidase S1 domain-containing protein n=1 Tax=Arctia plantaginis TaxID=874455 RepID=A0A8S0ZQL0_ARCPL|nr:unnamed protein product [Arctia plantaginis]
MNKTLIHFFLVLVLSFSSTEKVPGLFPRLVGGHLAPYEYGKFHASLQNLTNYHVCGGGIVSEWVVVTAAHCVDGVNPDYIKIVAGTNYLGAGRKRYDVAEIIPHYNYEHTEVTKNNDIALVITKEPFDLNYANVIGIRKQELVEGDNVSLTGFGAQEPYGLSSYHLHILNITVFSQETCEFAMRYSRRNVTKEMFCTFSRIGQGTCHGDSGSPVIKNNELVGVVSWGIPCAVGFPDVHTRITPYVEWIQKHILRAYCADRREPRSIYRKLIYLARRLSNVSEGHKRFLGI